MSERPGPIFESLYTRRLQAELGADESRAELRDLDAHEAPERLARHLALEFARVLRALPGDEVARRRAQADVANRLLKYLHDEVAGENPEDVAVVAPPQELRSRNKANPPPRTALPFSISALLTRGRHEPNLAHELAREIATADRIEALVSFVTVGGVRTLFDELETHARAGRPLRLLTTTYMGATEAKALDWLARLPGVQIRISYDARRSRLHAKAWLFRRETGLDTAYVGSANWSRAALTEGQEWMIKASASDLPHVIDKFEATFETLWHDPEFEPYHPDIPGSRERLREALRTEAGGSTETLSPAIFFTLAPYPFQQAILDRLAAERQLHGRVRNLVVAATGTGKTMIAAFDYARRIGPDHLPPRLLVLAHRKELLEQARITFRHVLREGAFGELLADGVEPIAFDHLFATIQSFNSRGLAARFGANYWEHVIVDECHHAPADSYRGVMTTLQPGVLVGLTATPEREDGRSLLDDFDGHVAAELRLWDALDRRLLVPFEYHGLHDGVDLRDVRFTRGRYQVDGLEKLYTGNDRRAELVFEQLRRRVADPTAIRALGFCVSVAHAEFMAAKFSAWGVPAISVHGASSSEERRVARQRLAAKEVNVIFTCDLYNEGVDLPFVDTLLLLRPTESATLFLQQLGRGLRLYADKSSCLVLDFIGLHREEFRFDAPLTALTGLPRGALSKAVEQGFPLLPSGCQLILDRVAQRQVIENLKRSMRGGRTRLVADLKMVVAHHSGPVSLPRFLADAGRELSEVFTENLSWAALRRLAGQLLAPEGPAEASLAGRLRHVLHIDEPDRLDYYITWLRGAPVGSAHGQIWQQMLAYALFHERDRTFDALQFEALLTAHPAVREDLVALFELLRDEVGLVSARSHEEWPFPLALHRKYIRREILSALGHWTTTAKPDVREGVLRLEAQKVEVLFVTLNKPHDRFTPTTRYEDYALDAHHFHWQSQSQTRPESSAGRRYIEQAVNGWRFLLCVRHTRHDAYAFLGPVHYVRHQGSRPMNIVWRLQMPMPGACLQECLQYAS